MQHLPDTGSYNFRILGYADYRGTEIYNDTLSRRRANSVARWLETEYPEKVHRLLVLGEGELPPQVNVPLKEQRTVSVETYLYRERSLKDLVRGDVGPMDEIVLEDLHFQPGRHFLLLESVPVLKKIEKILKKRPEYYIEIAGHVCCVGDFSKDGFDHDTQTHNLSANRAENIYNYLVRNGIDSSRMVHKGYGYSEPKAYPEETDDDKDQNRRVEIRIIGKIEKKRKSWE
jgi:outer membrane protein OmpA-like peptidoglycan-associated protein